MKHNLSIIVTHHNQPRIIWDCLRSIWACSAKFQLTVMDDCSNPPLDIPPWYVTDCINFKDRMGVQRCRNLGYRRAQRNESKFILFCDGDIVWEPQAIDIMLDVLSQAPDDVAFVYSDYKRAGALEGTWNAGVFNADRLRNDNYISTMSMCKVSHLPDPPFVEDEERFQDWSLWLRILARGGRGVYIPKVLFTAHYNKLDISLRGTDHCKYWKEKIRSRHVGALPV